MQNLREMVNQMRPPTLIRFGLAKALTAYLEDFAEKHPEIKLHPSLIDDKQGLSENARLGLYRIAQEALTNMVKHAGADQGDVTLVCVDHHFILEIRDNGKGFALSPSLADYSAQGHFGLVGMKERAEAINAGFRVSSSPGEGTSIRVVVPVDLERGRGWEDWERGEERRQQILICLSSLRYNEQDFETEGGRVDMKLVTVAEMRAIEKEADAKGVSYEQMMERAGQGIAGIVQSFEWDWDEDSQVVVGLVGSGNNGGDALVALAALAEEGWQAKAYIARPRPADDPLIKRLLEKGGEVLPAEEDVDYKLLDAWLRSAFVLLDGILGTGIQLPLRPELARLLRHVSDFTMEMFVIAVDVPSGVDADTGQMAEETIPADITATMEAVKTGLLLFPAFERVGALEVVDLGLPEDLKAEKDIHRWVVTENDARQNLPERPVSSHKGTFGTALVVAGSLNFTGAAFLAGKAAYRIGAGLVRLGIPGPLHAVLAGRLPEATWLLLPSEMGSISEKAWDVLRRNLEKVDALLFGPGFGMEEPTKAFVRALVTNKPLRANRPGFGFVNGEANAQAPTNGPLPPIVIDADGLKLLAEVEEWPKLLPGTAVLTPHPGEMAVLTGMDVADIQSDRLEVARKYAQEWGHVVVLKGALTVIAAPDGQVAVIPVATSALATAGTGDVLAGIIVGLRAQGLAAFEAATTGAWIHAQAGLYAADEVGSAASVIAGDVLEAIPSVLWEMEY